MLASARLALRRLLLISLLLGFVISDDSVFDESSVTVLTASDFDDNTAKGDWLLEFYAPVRQQALLIRSLWLCSLVVWTLQETGAKVGSSDGVAACFSLRPLVSRGRLRT